MTDINVGALSEAINEKTDRDLGNITSEGKEVIVAQSIPDYSSPISDLTSPYTCLSNIFIIFACSDGQRLNISVDGTQIYSGGTYGNDVYALSMYFKKGSVVSFTGGSVMCAFPLIGG
jgi:hypothetical protein